MGGGLQGFWKNLIVKWGGQNKWGWVGTKYKREETKLGLSLKNTLLTLLNISISSILRSHL